MNHKGILSKVIFQECFHAKAKARLMLHVSNWFQKGIKYVTVWSNDTDVVVLLAEYSPEFTEGYADAAVTAMYGVGEKIKYLSIKSIATDIEIERCRELLFTFVYWMRLYMHLFLIG